MAANHTAQVNGDQFDADLRSYMKSQFSSVSTGYLFPTTAIGSIFSTMENAPTLYSNTIKTIQTTADLETSSAFGVTSSGPYTADADSLHRTKQFEDLAQAYRASIADHYSGATNYSHSLESQLYKYETGASPLVNSATNNTALNESARPFYWLPAYSLVVSAPASDFGNAADTLFVYGANLLGSHMTSTDAASIGPTTNHDVNQTIVYESGLLYLGDGFSLLKNSVSWAAQGRKNLAASLRTDPTANNISTTGAGATLDYYFRDGTYKEQAPGYDRLALIYEAPAYYLDAIDHNQSASWPGVGGASGYLAADIHAYEQLLEPSGLQSGFGDTDKTKRGLEPLTKL